MKNPSLASLAFALALAQVVVACSEDTSGEGIGRPPSQLPTRPERLALAVTEVFAADGDASSHFVELHSQGDEGIALDGLFVETATATQALSGTLAADARLAVATPSLALDRTVGEVAVTDGTGFVHAYLAWGGSPATQHTALSGRALASGALGGDDFAPTGYPMPDGLAVHREADAAGCGTPTPGLAPDAGELAAGLVCPVTASAVRISELMVEDGVGYLGSWVELENTADATIAVERLRLCQFVACVTLPPETTIPAHGHLAIYLGVVPNAAAQRLHFADAPRLLASGEVALFRPGSADVLDPTALISYVRYGAQPGRLVAAAVAASLWPALDTAVRPPRVVGEAMALNPSGPLATWYPASPTSGTANAQLDPDTDQWTSCSYPRPWRDATPSSLFVEAIRPADVARGLADTIMVANRGAQPIQLAGYRLEVDDDSYPLPLGRLIAPGESHAVELHAVVCSKTQDHCREAQVLHASGVLTFGYDDGSGIALRQYVRWGEATSTRTLEAVTGGLWPHQDCAAPLLAGGFSLELAAGASGHSPADYSLVAR